MSNDKPVVKPQDLPPIQEVASWVEHLPALLQGIIAAAGPDGKGIANEQARVLDARTRYLKALFENLTLGGLFLKGVLASEEELLEVDTKGLAIATTYWLDFSFRIWNGKEWINTGSLRGPRGLTPLGSWPDDQELPSPEDSTGGDCYLWRNDLWVNFPHLGLWKPLGVKGADGKSAYQLWEARDENKGKTNEAFLDSLVPLSNYDLWLQAGNKGSLHDFLRSLKAETAARIVQVKDTLVIDPFQSALFVIDNTAPGIQEVSINNYTYTHGAEVDVVVKGSVGSVSFSEQNLVWGSPTGNAKAPVFGKSKTRLKFFWDGEEWLGVLVARID